MSSVAREWTVLTWNLQGTKRTDLDAVTAEIERREPDVVLLQEVRHDQATDLAQRLRMRFSWAFKHSPVPLLGRWTEGAAILTPHLLDAAGHTVVSRVRSKRSWKRRIAQWALVGRPDGSAYRVYNLHLSPHALSVERREEAVRMASIIAEHGDAPPAIVAGDLNDQNDPTIVFTLPGIEHLAPPPTNPSEAPVDAIDHVLLPADATDVWQSVPSGGPTWARLSDHLPLTVGFSLDWVEGDLV